MSNKKLTPGKMNCIFKFKADTGLIIVKCTKHEIEGQNAI